MRHFFFLILLVLVAACTAKRPAESVHEITGTRPERIARITAIITKRTAPPTALKNAYFVEEQVGDGYLGPSDFSSFYALSVAPNDVAAWRSVLSPLEPLNNPAHYAAPKKAASWWLSAPEFSSLEFYSPKLLTGRINGWVGIQPQTGRIFIYAFTM